LGANGKWEGYRTDQTGNKLPSPHVRLRLIDDRVAHAPEGVKRSLAAEISRLIEDRFGSSTDLTTPKFDFRSFPESGLKSALRHFRFVPATDSCTAATASLFDHPIGLAMSTRGNDGLAS